jgi:cell division protein FtsW
MSTKSVHVDQKRKRHPLYLGIDSPLLLTVIALLVFGLLMLYSASWGYSVQIMGQHPSYLFQRQLRFLVGGSILAIIAFYFDYHRIKKLVIPMMLATLVLLLMVIYFNEVRLGARRGLFQGSIQPSELAKLVVVIYLAFWMNAKKDVLHELSFGLLPMAAILGISSALILSQPDLSAAVTIFAIGGLMFFIGGGEMRQIIPAMIVALAIGVLLILVYSTGQQRISDFIDGIRDPMLASDHLVRSFEAIVRGGLFGVGIGRANTKFTGLPVAPTDSIFAVVAEETGVLGASIVVLLFILFLWRGLAIARNAPDLLGQMLAAGITIWITLEAAINMGVMVNLLPFAGNALPFFSLGGSNLVTALVGVGILMNVARQTAIQNNEEERRPLNAVVSLRRDDGRRRVSRPRRSAGG